jgi:hypothetical protein
MAKKTEEKKEKKKQHPNSLKNLIPLNQRTPQQRKEIAKMGAEATNKKIRKRKTFREIIEALGVSDATETEKQKFLQMFPGADPDEITKDMMLVASMYNQGIGRGNVKAAAMIRDTAGEKPDTTISGSITTEKIFISADEKKAALKHIAEVVAESTEPDDGDR